MNLYNNEGKSLDNPEKEIIEENPKFNQLESIDLLTTDSINDSIITHCHLDVRKHLYFELRNFEMKLLSCITNSKFYS